MRISLVAMMCVTACGSEDSANVDTCSDAWIDGTYAMVITPDEWTPCISSQSEWSVDKRYLAGSPVFETETEDGFRLLCTLENRIWTADACTLEYTSSCVEEFYNLRIESLETFVLAVSKGGDLLDGTWQGQMFDHESGTATCSPKAVGAVIAIRR